MAPNARTRAGTPERGFACVGASTRTSAAQRIGALPVDRDRCPSRPPHPLSRPCPTSTPRCASCALRRPTAAPARRRSRATRPGYSRPSRCVFRSSTSRRTGVPGARMPCRRRALDRPSPAGRRIPRAGRSVVVVADPSVHRTPRPASRAPGDGAPARSLAAHAGEMAARRPVLRAACAEGARRSRRLLPDRRSAGVRQWPIGVTVAVAVAHQPPKGPGAQHALIARPGHLRNAAQAERRCRTRSRRTPRGDRPDGWS